MGVEGLLRYCREHQEDCVEQVDLIEIAKEKEGIEILVDFDSFEHFLMRKTLSVVSGNPYLRIIGGEYGYIGDYITKMIKDLKDMNIDLVMLIDGGKGSSKNVTERKRETCNLRHQNIMEKFQEILDICRNPQKKKKMKDTLYMLPVLFKVQILETLKECKCEVIQCAGEADEVLAQNLQSRPKAYTILSNDSDFCVFKDCRFIPDEFFDLKSDLQLGKFQCLPKKPIRLMVGVISTDKVVSSLKLLTQEALVEMSIVCGNDITRPSVRDIKDKLELEEKPMIDVADWVLKYGTVEKHPYMARELPDNPKLKEAILQSRQFYALEQQEDQDFTKGVISGFIDRAIERGKFPGIIMAMHLKTYKHRLVLEDNSSCVEKALSGLRAYVYRIVLDPHDRMVTEYGLSPSKERETSTVNAINDDQVRTANLIDSDNTKENLETFIHIMTHLEPEFGMKFFQLHGIKNGFTNYVLRYFLRLNTYANLNITMDEFMVVLATAYAAVEEPWYRTLPIVPPVRCVTIASWFQDIYRHAYLFLGKLLYLTHEFPQPKEIFCGSVFTAFYMALLQPGEMPPEVQWRVRTDMDKVFYARRHMTRDVVQGIFKCDDQC